MAIIYSFMYDPDFVNTTSIIDPVLKTGGQCVLSPQALSYFVNPQEFPDERTARSSQLNIALNKVPKLVVDKSEYLSFLTDIQDTWTLTERQNFFALTDLLFFAYNANIVAEQVELNLVTIPQYLPNTYVYSSTKTTTTAYLPAATSITVPDYVSFTYEIANGTQYEMRVYANNSLFMSQYPLSTIATVVPPLPLSQLYTLDLVSGIANVFTTALSVATLSQQTLQTYLQSGEYSGFVAQDVTLVDTNNNTTTVQFNILYNGAVPGTIAIRTAIQNLLLNSGVGTSAGWQARAPSVFVNKLWYLIPLWENKTTLVSSVVYPNVIPISIIQNDATAFLYDMEASFVTANLDVITSYYNNLTIAAVPDTENPTNALSLAAVHPTYQDVAPTNPYFNYMTSSTQQFATLLAAALAVAAGNPNTNGNLTTFTPTGDNRTYITFSAGSTEYYVACQAQYLNIVTT